MTNDEVKPVIEAGDEGVDQDIDIDLESLDQESDVEKLREQLRTTAAQKKHWREKHGKLAEDPRLKAVEKPVVKVEPKSKPGTIDPDALRAEITDEIMTRQKHDLTPDELKKAKALMSVEGKSLSEIVEDTYFQGYLSANRATAAKEKARPDSSNRGGNGKGSYTVDDLSDPVKVSKMSPDVFAKLSNEAGGGR